jgi:hypothetical protein
MLTRISERWDGEEWTASIELRMEIVFCEHGDESRDSVKYWELLEWLGCLQDVNVMKT